MLDGKLKPELRFDDLLETIFVTHNTQSLLELMKTTPQERARRAPLIRSLLRQVGMLSLNVAPDSQHLVAEFGNTLMQLHSLFSKAINRPEVSSDMALKGLTSYVSMIDVCHYKYMGFPDITEDAEDEELDFSNINKAHMDEMELGQVLGIKMLDNMLCECIINKDWDYKEVLETWLEKPLTLKDAVMIMGKDGQLRPYPKSKSAAFKA